MAVGADDDPLPTGLDPDALARAEAALASLSDNYLHWAEADLAALKEAYERCRAVSDPSEPLARLFTIAHDMKGQATTFGYPLVTELGHRLCREIERHPSTTTPSMQRLVGAIAEVLSRRLAGDGGAVGRDLLAGLEG